MLHVSRPEIDLPDGIDPHDEQVYAQGRAAFLGLQARGVLLRELAECYYVYRQTLGAHSQTGVALCCHVDDYVRDVIRKHEKTRADKEDDRTRHTLTLGANAGPVFLTYRDAAPIHMLVAGVTKNAPLYDFTATDGVRHTVWRVVRNLADWTAVFENVPVAYVADGHHRAAAAARTARIRRETNPAHTGAEEYNWFLAVLFPASHLRVLPYNRCVGDLCGLTPSAFLDRVAEVFEVSSALSPAPCGPHQAHMYLDGRWYRLRWQDTGGDPVSRLDVSVLQQRLLAPLLGIDDPRTSPRIRFIGGIRGADDLARRVDAGEEAVAFSMYPVTVSQVMEIADAGQIMPPKSTWFEPKLRSGLLIHTLD
jgi:uncharacterized protein (DUF1015 family)